MGFGDEKVVVDVRDAERARIVYKDAEGKEHTYYRARQAYFELEDLQTLVTLQEPTGGGEPEVVRRVRGTARLKDRVLSVVGDPNSRTNTLLMSFEVGDWRPRQESGLNEEQELFHGSPGGAMLGFSRHDWELGTSDGWWACCYLPKAFVEQLEAAILSGQVSGVSVGLSLGGLYTDEGDWETASSRRNLFIRPNKKDNDIRNPEVANGQVISFVFTTTKADLRAPDERASDTMPANIEDYPLRPEQPAELVASAITTLASRVDALRTTLKWVGGFIVAALLFVSGR